MSDDELEVLKYLDDCISGSINEQIDFDGLYQRWTGDQIRGRLNYLSAIVRGKLIQTIAPKANPSVFDVYTWAAMAVIDGDIKWLYKLFYLTFDHDKFIASAALNLAVEISDSEDDEAIRLLFESHRLSKSSTIEDLIERVSKNLRIDQ